MKSKWYEYRLKAIDLRKKGLSLKKIHLKLGVPVSTLSGWLRGIDLTEKQKLRLSNNSQKALIEARKLAAIYHKNKKVERLITAKNQALDIINSINPLDSSILDIALAFLYFGEGFKSNAGTGMGNSNPVLLRFFISVLRINYGISEAELKCELHLRADQVPLKMKRYWSKELKIPIKNFKSVSVDIRTLGKATYPTYKGVCVVRCGSVAIQRKLIYLSTMFCEKVAD